MTKSLQGHLLVAPPHQLDPDFVKTVTLLIQHSEQQAVGVVLNRPSSRTISEVWRGLYKKACGCEQNVNSGGPVPGPLMAVHSSEPFSEIEILPGVYYAVTKKNLDKLVRQADQQLKIFDSHAGWGPGQLEQQLAAGDWLSVPSTVDQVFSDDAGLWDEVVRLAEASR